MPLWGGDAANYAVPLMHNVPMSVFGTTETSGTVSKKKNATPLLKWRRLPFGASMLRVLALG